jgi:CHAT domain-containing protein
LFETNDRHEALKMAQDEVKKQYPNPYYWAAWVMLD